MFNLRPISISLSPNTEKDDIFLALKLVLQPWKWKKGEGISKIEESFRDYFGVKYAISFNSGRSALIAILKSLSFERGSEILLQGFTCNAVPNPILWENLTPIYVDCDKETFNIDLNDLKEKIGEKSKALIIQHTFGIPAKIEEILEICQKNNLILIEDCAHALGIKYQGRLLGNFGKVAFFSFSRDKMISCVYGGMVVTNDDILAEKIKKFQKEIGYPSYFWIFQQLLHPLLLNLLILPTYRLIGKYLLFIFQSFNILSKAVHWKEKRGEKPSYFPKRLPNALAILALNQFRKLERFNIHRQKLIEIYQKKLAKSNYKLPLIEKGNVLLRLPLLHPKAREIIKKAWQNNILIGDWYDKVIAPKDTKLEKMRYKIGSCPKAEELSKEILNLPTHINISEKEVEKIIHFLISNSNNDDDKSSRN
jgi:perosamine synthetase